MSESPWDRILQTLTDPYFLVMTVVLALILGILGNYATRLLDWLARHGVTLWKNRSEESRRNREKRIWMLLNSASYRESQQTTAIRHMFGAVFWFLILLLGVQGGLHGWIVGLVMVIAGMEYVTASNLMRDVREALTTLAGEELRLSGHYVPPTDVADAIALDDMRAVIEEGRKRELEYMHRGLERQRGDGE